ncbi:MAG: O-antigen ligase family protein [Clostridia bacterium]|nr:O-antigen ligase family protein [Clostridia bacterium]
MRRMKSFAYIRQRAPEIVAFFCAVFMLLAVPLMFHDAFFDINRFKVAVVCRALPVFALLFAAALLLRGPGRFAFLQRGEKGERLPFAMMAVFLLACVISCARTGFEEAVLTGSEGRYCGLHFLLCCGAAFGIIGWGVQDGRLLGCLAALCAAAIAALGFANAMGLDPLGFYDRIRQGQQSMFLSTIGHFDFFGTYLTLILPLAGGMYVFEERLSWRMLGALCAGVMAFGASAARTDSAFLSMHLSCVVLLALSGGSWPRLSRALILWGVCFLSLPVTKEALSHSVFHPEIDGLLLILCDQHIALLAALVLIAAGVLCALPMRRGVVPPSRKVTVRTSGIILMGMAALLLSGMLIFTVWAPEADIGKAASFLRLNDEWGSLRGAVYTRAVRAYADYGWIDKLFGRGLDLTLRILTPYFDDPAILVGGVFNDTHCQPLQFLLTCGLFGSAAFVALYGSLLALLLRRAGDDPLLCGAFAALCGYLVTMLLNVTQPILIATYFSVAALAMARVKALRQHAEGGISHEP